MNSQNPSPASPGNPPARTAQALGSSLKATASDYASGLKTGASRAAQSSKEAAVNQIDGLRQSIDDTARALDDKDPNLAWFAHRAADRVQRVADYLRDRDFAALREDCSDFARRHPAAFYGGLLVAGLVVGNMLKASARGGSGYGDDEAPRPGGSTYRPQAMGEVSGTHLPDTTLSPSAAAAI